LNSGSGQRLIWQANSFKSLSLGWSLPRRKVGSGTTVPKSPESVKPLGNLPVRAKVETIGLARDILVINLAKNSLITQGVIKMLAGHKTRSVYSPNSSSTLMKAAEEAAQRATLDALAAAIRQHRQLLGADSNNSGKEVLARVG
jgi:hypothetical protein